MPGPTRARTDAAKHALAKLPFWFAGKRIGPLLDVRNSAAMLSLEPECAMPALRGMGFTSEEIERAVATLDNDGLAEIEELADGYIRIHSRPEFIAWLKAAPSGTDPFVATPLQKDILKALNKRALSTDKLADEVAGGNRSQLYKSKKPGGLKELQSLHMVKNKRGVGHYRPDAPPPQGH